MAKYLVVDLQNCFMRSRYAANQGADVSIRIGLALHITLSGIMKTWKQHESDHVVFCGEGRSWRKDVDSNYKANRKVARAKETKADKEEMQLFFEMINNFIEYIKTKTNCTMLQQEQCEADDLIARWIQTHPTDEHVIVSTDRDFQQLIAHNVDQYDPVQDFNYTINGIFNGKGGAATNSKGEELPTPDPEFLLFLKCVKGDSGDNVFPSYPGARMKSTKKKVGITECYDDIKSKGYAWNSFMNHKWTHHDGTDRLVKNEFKKNEVLVDLTRQPDWIKDKMDEVISEARNKERVAMVGVHFIRFCAMYELTTLENHAKSYTSFLAKGLL